MCRNDAPHFNVSKLNQFYQSGGLKSFTIATPFGIALGQK